jgi:hypothetical protein
MTFRSRITLEKDGTITVDSLPFRAGERVEILIATSFPSADDPRYPLRGLGSPLIDPFEPAVPEDEWEACQ